MRKVELSAVTTVTIIYHTVPIKLSLYLQQNFRRNAQYNTETGLFSDALYGLYTSICILKKDSHQSLAEIGH